MAGKIKEISADQFETEVLHAEKVVVDFYSTECPPCEALASKFEGLSKIFGDDVKFIKIFRQENRALAESLGVTSSPTLLFYENGNLKEGRLTGGIKRSEILEHLEALLPASRVAELKKEIKTVDTECQVAVLGGGPAGLTASIYLAQAHIDTVMIDPKLPGGYVTTTHQVSNYPGFIEPQPGFMLSHYMSEQAKEAGVKFRVAVDVSSVNLKKKEILIDGYETIHAKAIIIATGSRPRPLNIPGENEYGGDGISYCATCDAKYYQDREVVVIGGGNSAIEESLFIARFAKKITIVHQFAELQANKEAQKKAFSQDNIEFLFEHEPREFIKHGTMDMEVVVENLKTNEYSSIRTNGIFIFVGFIPNVEMFNGHIEVDSWGYLVADEEMRTNLPGVYAVGDVKTKRYRQITTAVADGTIAAISLSKEL